VAGYLTYKRWRLRDGVDSAAVLDIVRNRIIPHYRTLDLAVRLGLETVEGSRAILAIQRWPDRAHRDRIMAGAAFRAWFDAYRPILQDWDRLVEFEAEWESRQLI
jgi:hypothetical protein